LDFPEKWPVVAPMTRDDDETAGNPAAPKSAKIAVSGAETAVIRRLN
jgi:hypothetical protein